jgi:hypothetical protein
MSVPVTAFIFVDEILISTVLPRVDRLLREEFDGVIEEDCFLILHDTETVVFDEPVAFETPRDAFDKLIGWPSMGGIEYSLQGGYACIWYLGRNPHLVESIRISISLAVYGITGGPNRAYYDRLVSTLHRELNAKRSIMEYALDSDDFPWAEESERLGRGIYDGEYQVDVRTGSP